MRKIAIFVEGQTEMIFVERFLAEYLDNPESYGHPSGTVDKIFQLFGQRYRKREKQSYRIVYKLDFGFLVCTDDILRKVTSWRYFLACIDESFSGITVPISEPAHVDFK